MMGNDSEAFLETYMFGHKLNTKQEAEIIKE
jgi:hypothetical protein